MSIMVADIGNSTISVGISKGTGIDVYRMVTHPVVEAQEYHNRLAGFMDISRIATVAGSAMCSVVPDASGPFAEALTELTGLAPLVLGNEADSGITLDVENPTEIGADRIAALAGASTLTQPPFAVVDFGTATTVNFVDPDDNGGLIFRGGAIMPGMGLMADAMASQTAQLPKIRLGSDVKVPGRNTEGNMLAGVVYATCGGVERIIDEAELRGGLKYNILLTGGLHEFAANFIRREAKCTPNLILRGLLLIHKRLRGI